MPYERASDVLRDSGLTAIEAQREVGAGAIQVPLFARPRGEPTGGGTLASETSVAVARAEVERYYLYSEVGRLVRIWEMPDRQQTHVFRALDALDNDARRRLAQALSATYRGNHVARMLRRHSKWRLQTVPVGNIVLPKFKRILRPALRRHRFRLRGLASDPSVRAHPDVVRIRDVVPILRRTIGVPSGDTVKLRDGIHRAIRLTICGHDTLEVYVAG
ncbi:MAG: hypothetical protein ACE5O2_09490 [Armatimonadota bacterium]